VVLGRTEPRLATEPLRRLTKRTTLGFEAAEFCESVLGMDLLPWQRWWLLHALEVDDGGGFRFRTVVTLMARQNGKTTLLKALALWAMYLGRARLVLAAAQSLDIARESWQGAVDMTQGDPDLAGEVETIRRANGEQELRLTNGARYRITAASRSAGRGLSVDLLILDELREHRDWLAWGALSKTTIARPNGLTVAISNAGDDQSIVLNALRDSALAGTDPSLGLFEWSAPDGCDLDDVDGLAQANPALGVTLPLQALVSARSTDPAAVYRTECMCQRVDSLADVAVPADAWAGCMDPAMTLDGLRDRVAVAVDVAPDLGHATLVAAAVGADGRVRVEAVASWGSTGAMLADLPGWVERIKPRARGFFRGPADAVRVDLENFGFEAIAEVAPACQGFAEQVTGRRLLHAGDGLLTSHVTGTKRYPVADGWRFVRRGVGHCDAAYAAAGATHLARTLPVSVGRPRILVARSA
jgi:hypothetical protein